MGLETVFPRTVFHIFGIPIQDIVFHTWIVMAVLGGLAYWAGKNLSIRPKLWQYPLEIFAEYVNGLLTQRIPRHIPGLFDVVATFLLYIAVSNLLGLIPGLKAPTRSLSTTIALSLFSFVAVHYFGVKERGVGRYARSFAEPVGCILPLNLMGQISRTVAMALRLFGNVVASESIAAVMFQLVPLVAPLPFNLLGMVTGVLQALVFTYLTIVFIADAVGEEDASEEEEIIPPES